MPSFYTSYPKYQGSTATREDNFAFEKARAHAVMTSSQEGHPRVMRFVTSLAALRQANMAGTGHGAHIASINKLTNVSIQVIEDLGRVWPSQVRNNFRVIRGEHGALAVAEHAVGVEITDDPEVIQGLTEHFGHLIQLAKPLGEITVPVPVSTPLPDHGMGHRPLPGDTGGVVNTPPL